MAGADYAICHVCHKRVFFDGNVDYEEYGGCLGAMAVLCDECTRTHELVVKRKSKKERGDVYKGPGPSKLNTGK